ncbi:MAG: hypothetical protein OHK0029_35420 [Armatimonadaceae bacterium]
MNTIGTFAPYANSDITRNNPSCFLFLIDQSSSMASRFGNREQGVTKAEGVAHALNNLLRNLILTCSKSDGIRDYFHVGVIGYGAMVAPAWTGALTGQELLPISFVADHYARIVESRTTVNDLHGNPTEQTLSFPVWVEPAAQGSTPMCQALRYTYDILAAWCLRNQTSHPPVVVHITDGEATDGDAASEMASLTTLQTSNGTLILFNIHLSSRRDAAPTTFPDSEENLPDDFARMLYRQASFLTPYMRQVAWDQGTTVSETAKAFVLNADPTQVVLALEIGTRPGAVW